MKKIVSIILMAVLLLTACRSTSKEINADISTEAASQNVTSAEESTTAAYKFTSASGTATVLKTAVLCLVPEGGAGYAGFLAQGTEVELKETDATETWSLIEYDNEKYYILSSYLDLSGSVEAKTSEDMSQTVTSENETLAEKESSTSGNGTAGNSSTDNSSASNSSSTSGSSSTGNSGKPSASGNSTSNNSKPSGSSSSGSNSSGSNSSGGSPSGNSNSSSGSVTTVTPAPPATQAQPAPAPTPTKSYCETNGHNWVPVYGQVTKTEQVWVVDQEAYDEPIYEWRTYCNKCGADLTYLSDNDFAAHIGTCKSAYHDEYIQIDTIHHDEVGYYGTVEKTEIVQTGSKCTVCGATK